MKRLLFIFGTRPEAIKFAPLVKAFQNRIEEFETKVCVTAQHRTMLDQVLNFFSIKPDYDLNIMRPNQTLFDITAESLKGIEAVLNDHKPEFIFVQGDTTTAFIGALSAFYKKIKILHIEAGLRSFNKYSPFPEEANRLLIGRLADYHFAPTELAKQNLYNEGIKNNIYVTGNTIIDALFLCLKIIKEQGEERFIKFFNFINLSNKIILVTMHRRESFGQPFRNICYALKNIADKFEDVEIVYPMHLNPNVRKPVSEILNGHKRIHLIEPLEYPYLIWLMSKSYIILTDSGGIQEEAPSLKKPVLVMRDITERIEGIEAMTSKLIGTNKDRIVQETEALLLNALEYTKMAKNNNPYGNGTTCNKIINILEGV